MHFSTKLKPNWYRCLGSIYHEFKIGSMALGLSSAPYISITYCCVKHANIVKKQSPIHAFTNHRSWNMPNCDNAKIPLPYHKKDSLSSYSTSIPLLSHSISEALPKLPSSYSIKLSKLLKLPLPFVSSNFNKNSSFPRTFFFIVTPKQPYKFPQNCKK